MARIESVEDMKVTISRLEWDEFNAWIDHLRHELGEYKQAKADLVQQVDDWMERYSERDDAVAECREVRDDFAKQINGERRASRKLRNQRDGCREELVAAEARERELGNILDRLHTLLDFEEPVESLQEMVAPFDPRRLNEVFRRAYGAVHGELLNHAALDAALEARTIEVLEAVASLARGGDWPISSMIDEEINALSDVKAALEQARDEERERWYTYIASLDVDSDEVRLQQDILKAIRKEAADERA